MKKRAVRKHSAFSLLAPGQAAGYNGRRNHLQEVTAMAQVNTAPLLDVYAAAVSPELAVDPVFSPARNRTLAETRAPALLRQRYLVWHLLEYAARHSLGLDPAALVFEKTPEGRWSCPEFEFSLSHTADAVAVAVSRAPVGVDVESLPLFRRRYGTDPGLCWRMLRRIAAEAELAGSAEQEAETLLRLWTGKESLFKYGQTGTFVPSETVCGPETQHLLLDLPPQICLAVSSDQLSALRVFRFSEERAVPVESCPLPFGAFL